jgi:hypothetical protein
VCRNRTGGFSLERFLAGRDPGRCARVEQLAEAEHATGVINERSPEYRHDAAS